VKTCSETINKNSVFSENCSVTSCWAVRPMVRQFSMMKTEHRLSNCQDLTTSATSSKSETREMVC